MLLMTYWSSCKIMHLEYLEHFQSFPYLLKQIFLTHLEFISHKFSRSQINIRKTLFLTNLENLSPVTKVYEILAVLGMLLLDFQHILGDLDAMTEDNHLIWSLSSVCIFNKLELSWGQP